MSARAVAESSGNGTACESRLPLDLTRETWLGAPLDLENLWASLVELLSSHNLYPKIDLPAIVFNGDAMHSEQSCVMFIVHLI